MRALVPTLLLLVSAFAGTAANASGVIEVCHPDRVIAESGRDAKEAQFYTGHEERNETIQSWLKTATRQEISEIWGDPFITADDILRWEIPSESSQSVSDTVFENGKAYCYYSSFRKFTFVVREPRVTTSDAERTISRTVMSGSSTFTRK